MKLPIQFQFVPLTNNANHQDHIEKIKRAGFRLPLIANYKRICCHKALKF
jgi:hypothetical protein